jgi:alkylhydroperoxidase family enzyme
MPVLRQVPRSDASAKIVIRMYDLLFGDRDPVSQPGTATGTPGNWWTVFALVPDILQHAVDGFAVYRNPARRIDPVLRELGQTRAGWARGSQFVFSQHCKSLRALGVADAKIEAIAHWTVSDLFDAQERAVLAYADGLCLANGRVPDAVFAALRRFWDDAQILEFTYITCLYDMHALMARALRLELDDRPDPIVEVAAPAGFQATDFLGTALRSAAAES